MYMEERTALLEDEALVCALVQVLPHVGDELIVAFLHVRIGDLAVIRENDEAGILASYQVPEHAVLCQKVARALAE